MSAYTMAISLRPPAALPARSSPLPVSLTTYALPQRLDRKLPVPDVYLRFWQAGDLPCLAAASVPITMRIAKCAQPQRQVTPIEPLGIPPHCDDWLVVVAVG